MKPYQRRVLDERADLEARIARLGQFLRTDKYADLPEAERVRMAFQLSVMKLYSGVLAARITAFGD